MKSSSHLSGEINYRLIRSRRKTLAIIIEADGSVVVRAPLRATLAQIEAVVMRTATWIKAKQELTKISQSQPAPKRFVAGETFPYLGQTYPLQIVTDGKAPLILDGTFQLQREALPQAEEVFTAWYRRRAAEVIGERVKWYARRHGFTYQCLRISSARTRWGSCSSKGTLSFTWRLVMAPLVVIDYVILHELVHLLVKNHSKEFWARLGELMPDYQTHRQWLRKNATVLAQIFG